MSSDFGTRVQNGLKAMSVFSNQQIGEENLLIASITRTSSAMFGMPACQRRRSRITMLPFSMTGWLGPRTCLRCSSRSWRILPLALVPLAPSWTCRPDSSPVWVLQTINNKPLSGVWNSALAAVDTYPSQISVLPFSGVNLIRGTLTTSANG